MDLQLLVRLLRVEADGLDGGDHHGHAEGDGDEEHDDVLGSVLQGQLLLISIYLLIRAAAAAATTTTTVRGGRARPSAQPRLHQDRATCSVRCAVTFGVMTGVR